MNLSSLVSEPLAASLFAMSHNTTTLLAMHLPRYLSEIQVACSTLMQGLSPERALLLSLAKKLNLVDVQAKILQSSELEQQFAAIRECLGSNPKETKPPPPISGGECSLQQLEMLLDGRHATIPINEKILQHILGGYFGAGTKLESYSSQGMLEYVLNMLDRKLAALKDHPLCSREETVFRQTLGLRNGIESPAFQAMRAQFKQAHEIGKILQKDGPGTEGNFNEFFRVLSSKVDKLPTGEGFFFQGGWSARAEGEGHAISLEVIKETDDRLTFRIYNRGAGLDFHTQTIVAGKKFHFPLTEIVHIPLKNFNRPVIAKALYDLMHTPPETYKWKPEDFYQVLLPQLGGEVSSKIYTIEQLMETLDTGHCSFLSLTALVFQHLQNPELYRRWEFEFQLATLWGFFEQHQDQLVKSERMRHLLQKSSEQMARTAREAFYTTNSQGLSIINLAEWTYANEKISQIQKKLKDAHAWYLQNDAKLARPSFRFQKGDLSWAGSTAVIHPQLSEGTAAQLVITRPAEGLIDPENLRSEVQQFQDLAEKISKTGPSADFSSIAPFLRLKEAIQKIVLKMSMESVLNGQKLDTEEFLPLGSTKEVADTLQMLKDLGRQFLWASMNAASYEPDRAEATRATDYLTILKLLTLADAVSRKYANSYGDICVELPNLYQWDMGFVLNGRSGAAHVFDPKWEAEILHLRNYWCPDDENTSERLRLMKERDFVSFFGFERFPASTALDLSIHDWHSKRFFHERADMRQDKWDSKLQWQDIEWAVQWIARPEIAAKIRLFSADLAKKSPYVQAVYFLADEHTGLVNQPDVRPQLFPPSFLTLRELSFSADFLLKSCWDPESFSNSEDFQKGPTLKGDFPETGGAFLYQLRPFNSLTKKDSSAKFSKCGKILMHYGPYGLDGGQFLAKSQDMLPEVLQNLYSSRRNRSFLRCT